MFAKQMFAQLRTGFRGGAGGKRVKARPRAPNRKTEEAVDRRQNDGSVKAVSPRHCAAASILRNCSLNCCAEQSDEDRVGSARHASLLGNSLSVRFVRYVTEVVRAPCGANALSAGGCCAAGGSYVECQSLPR